MATGGDAVDVAQAVEILQTLLRFDTTNPPGNEAACVTYMRDLLQDAGIATTLLALDPARPNLIARLRGRGAAPPLLLYGHADVVPAEHQMWTHPPFAGVVKDGAVWGRGALDMKGGLAMMLAAVLRARAKASELPGDVVLAVVSDEEAGGYFGARFLVERHAEQFAGVRYALGEFGAYTMRFAGRRFYPIMVAEKQSYPLRATLRGPGGHAAFPVRGGAMSKTARMLHQIEQTRLPVHLTTVVQHLVPILADAAPPSVAALVRDLLKPELANQALDVLTQFGTEDIALDPLLHHTLVPTIIGGGAKNNVVPSEVTVELDGRILPGWSGDEFLAEVRSLVGTDVELEPLFAYEPLPTTAPDMGLYATLAAIVRDVDAEGIALPYMLGAVTDARFFARLGIQTYGFLPMRLPDGWHFLQSIHAADERIPAEAVIHGTDALHAVLRRFGEA